MMRKLLFTLIGFVLVFAAIGQQPENPGFENWEDVGLNNPEPVDWSSIKTSDGGSFLNGLAPYVWDQSTDAHSGTYSVKLYNASVIGIVAAGTVTNGRIHAEISGTGWAFTDPGDARWNTPYTEKPDSIVIWAKHFPAGADVAQVKALLHTGSAKIPDPAQVNYIAEAGIYIPDATSTWTRFSAPFTYLNGNVPEYILLVVSSADDVVATVGTEAWFDDIELIYNPVILDLTVFMQGPYNTGNEMFTHLNSDHIPLNQPYNVAPWNYNGTESVAAIPNADVVDWVVVEIRDAASAGGANSFASIGRQAGFLLKDGSVAGLNGTDRLSFDVSINQNLFVVIWHRNHLGIMSAYPLTKANGMYTYDFSDAVDKTHNGALGNIQLEMFGPGLWGMISGDGDANGTIESADKTNFWSILVGKTGYLSADYNMDGQTNNPDKNDYWLDNLTKESQVPN